MTNLSLPKAPAPGFEITHDGAWRTGTDGAVIVTVPESGDSKMFKRNGIRMPMGHGGTRGDGATQERSQWLVAELDGVRCYVKAVGARTHIVMTKDDLYP